MVIKPQRPPAHVARPLHRTYLHFVSQIPSLRASVVDANSLLTISTVDQLGLASRHTSLTVRAGAPYSALSTIGHAAWRLGLDPTLSIKVVTSRRELANGLGAAIYEVTETGPYQRDFHATKLKPVGREFATTAGGRLVLLELADPRADDRADLIIVDTPQQPEDMVSSASRSAGFGCFQFLLRTLSDHPEAGVLLIAPELHKHDIASLWLGKPERAAGAGAGHAE